MVPSCKAMNMSGVMYEFSYVDLYSDQPTLLAYNYHYKFVSVFDSLNFHKAGQHTGSFYIEMY